MIFLVNCKRMYPQKVYFSFFGGPYLSLLFYSFFASFTAGVASLDSSDVGELRLLLL